MKVKELKPILEHLDDDFEVNFTIVSKKEDNESKETIEWIPFGGDDSYDESFWA